MMNNGYVHSDIKEDNMQFSNDNKKVIIFDFGMSRWQETGCDGKIIGCTPVYASPLTTDLDVACLDDDLHSVGMIMFFHFYNIPTEPVFVKMINAVLIDKQYEFIVSWALRARIVTMILPTKDDVGLANIIKKLIIPKSIKLETLLVSFEQSPISLKKQAIITTELGEAFTYNVPTFEQIIDDLMQRVDNYDDNDDDNNYKYEFNNLSPSSKFEFDSNVNFNDANYIFSRIFTRDTSTRATPSSTINKNRNFVGLFTPSNIKNGFKSIIKKFNWFKSSSSNKNMATGEDMATGKEIVGGLKRRKNSFTKINNVHTKRRRRHLKKLTYKRTS
jgi:serine/threonine protein kinase